MKTIYRFVRRSVCGAALVLLAGVAVAGGEAPPPVERGEAPAPPRFKAIAFDYFVLFNPDSVVSELEQVFPGKGRELTTLWRTRQF